MIGPIENMTMEELSSQPQSEQLAQSLREGRSRTGEALAAQRERMNRLEEELVDHIQHLAEELAHEGHGADGLRSDLEVQLEALEQKKLELVAEQQQWTQTQEKAQTEQREIAEYLEKQQNELKEREDQLRDAEQATEGDAEEHQQQLEDSRRRFEMAVEELRELKTRNAELEEKLVQRGASPAEDDAGDGTNSWEAQKLRLLASLEADVDEEEEEDRRKRLTIEGTIRITDEIVAKKQDEIDELTKLLDDQSSRVGDVAVGAAAIAQIIDQDELIQEERARLEQLKTEWKEKLRKAEVDVSVERANLARHEVELQNKMETLEAEAAKLERQKENSQANPPDRGRWLTRLGLKDKED